MEIPSARPPPSEVMSVTAFGMFLQSPYLFYLSRIARAEARDDTAREMDALAFGSLTHETLEAFGRSDVRFETDAAVIEAFCAEALSELALARFGPSPPAPVWVQLDMARRRLARFAKWQADWARAGWRIIDTEWKPDESALPKLDIPGGPPIALRGMIDRVDRRGADIAILDYKTSAKPAPPKITHGPKRGRWRNLQLPLYRFMYPGAAGADCVRLGYIALPSETDRTQFLEGEWTAHDLGGALNAARAVVQRIREASYDDLGSIQGLNDVAIESLLARRQITATAPFRRLRVELAP
jgi:RecB family exonuclease